MEYIPTEINYEFLFNLSGPDLFNLCRVNRYYNAICNDETFWRQKLLYEFGPMEKPSNLTWKQFYTERFFKIIDLSIDNVKFGSVLIDHSDDLERIVERANQIYVHNFNVNNLPLKLELVLTNGSRLKVLYPFTTMIHRAITNVYEKIRGINYITGVINTFDKVHVREPIFSSTIRQRD